MRVGIDCRLWNESGVGRYTRNLVTNLLEIDIDNQYVLFALTKDIDDIKYQIANSPGLDKRSGAGKNANQKSKIIEVNIRWHTIREQFEFPKVLYKENLDLMHFPYFSVPIFYKKPFVITIHDVIVHYFPTGQASTMPLPIYRAKLLGYKYIISQAAKNAKKIIVPLEATKKEVIKTLKVNPNKVEVTYEGADDFGSSTINSKLITTNLKNLSSDKFFLYVGNAYPHKNLLRLLKAVENFKFQISNFKLVMVGKEDYFYKRVKEKVKQKGLDESVVFYGYATDEELGWLYKNAVALVAPSLMEGFGLPLLEAMASKCLVLASDIPSFREVCQDSAIYFKNRNAQDIADSMKLALVMDKKNKEMRISRGFQRSQEFSWKVLAERTLEIYKNAK